MPLLVSWTPVYASKVLCALHRRIVVGSPPLILLFYCCRLVLFVGVLWSL